MRLIHLAQWLSQKRPSEPDPQKTRASKLHPRLHSFMGTSSVLAHSLSRAGVAPSLLPVGTWESGERKRQLATSSPARPPTFASTLKMSGHRKCIDEWTLAMMAGEGGAGWKCQKEEGNRQRREHTGGAAVPGCDKDD